MFNGEYDEKAILREVIEKLRDRMDHFLSALENIKPIVLK
jgi:hypothetical protein